MVTLAPISDFHSLRKLNEGETIQSFNCGDTELNDFIINRAAKYRDELLAVSYVLEENDTPIAYFSLSNDNLSYEKFQQKTSFNRLNRAIDNAKRMKQYPAVKIGRLAIDESHRNSGVGRYLLSLIKSSMIINQKSGCRFITVDACNDAIGFYEKNGFNMVNTYNPERRTQSMFFDLAQLL